MRSSRGEIAVGRVWTIVVGLAGVLVAGGARRPVIRRWPASILQAVPCMPASETPGALSLVHAAAGLAALRGGGWRRASGVAGAAANLLAIAALADLRKDAARSAAVFDEALAPLDAPPDDLHADPGPGPHRFDVWRIARRRHLRAAGIAYGDDPAQQLDIWGPVAGRRVPGAGAGPAPVLVQVHGGGWTAGAKEVSSAPLLAHLVARGWVCVSIDYRLAPAHRWPALIVDVKMAIAWVREHIAEYGGDPDFIAISGNSAGAHLAALAALSPNDPAFQPGFSDADTTVAAAVPVFGVHDFTVDDQGLAALLENTVIGRPRAEAPDVWLQASPLHRVDPGGNTPPFLVVHGSTDTIAWVGQSRRLVARMREAGAPVHYAELPRAQHGFDGFPTARTRHHVRAVHRFLSAVLATHRAAAPAAVGAGS